MQPVADEFRSLIAQRLRADHEALASRWLSRLAALLPVDEREVFPSDHLLDHIPDLIVEIAEYLDRPEREAIVANAQVIAKARDLGSLRFAQRASLHQIMREYALFEGVLSAFVREELSLGLVPPSPDEIVDVIARVHQAVNVLQQSTLESFIDHYSETVSAQRGRLETFNRMVSHELRQPLGALQFAVRLLQASTGSQSEAERARLLDLLKRNIDRSLELTQRLTRLSGLYPADTDLQIQRVELTTIVQEVARQLRDMAEARGVTIRVSDALPEVTVDVGALELILINLISNAVKYSDPRKPDRFVEIAPVPADDGHCAIQVRDNGIGVPASRLDAIFREYFRAHAQRDAELAVDGLGLGLAIVKDCLRPIGGRIEVDSEEGLGTTFTVRFPVRPPS